MQCKLLWSVTAGVAVALAAGVGLALVHKPVEAAPQQHPDDSIGDKKGQLPIAQVVLFSSGVGYFQREGTVEGNTRVDLSFPVQDINDLLYLMVFRILSGA